MKRLIDMRLIVLLYTYLKEEFLEVPMRRKLALISQDSSTSPLATLEAILIFASNFTCLSWQTSAKFASIEITLALAWRNLILSILFSSLPTNNSSNLSSINHLDFLSCKTCVF